MNNTKMLIDYNWPWSEFLDVKIDWIDFILQLSQEKYNRIMELKANWVKATVAITNPKNDVINIPIQEFKQSFNDNPEMIHC